MARNEKVTRRIVFKLPKKTGGDISTIHIKALPHNKITPYSVV